MYEFVTSPPLVSDISSNSHAISDGLFGRSIFPLSIYLGHATIEMLFLSYLKQNIFFYLYGFSYLHAK